MRYELKLFRGRFFWEDGQHYIPGCYELSTVYPFCKKCRTEVRQAYLHDPTGVMVGIKRKVKNVLRIRSRHLVVNADVYCRECYPKGEIVHKVLVHGIVPDEKDIKRSST